MSLEWVAISCLALLLGTTIKIQFGLAKLVDLQRRHHLNVLMRIVSLEKKTGFIHVPPI